MSGRAQTPDQIAAEYRRSLMDDLRNRPLSKQAYARRAQRINMVVADMLNQLRRDQAEQADRAIG